MKKEILLTESTIDEIIELTKSYPEYGHYSKDVIDGQLCVYIFGLGEADIVLTADGHYSFIFEDDELNIKIV